MPRSSVSQIDRETAIVKRQVWASICVYNAVVVEGL